MRFIPTNAVLLFIALSLFACKKSKDATPVIQPVHVPVIDSPAITQVVPAPSRYPYIDTFVGPLSVSFVDVMSRYDSTYPQFTFYVKHFSRDTGQVWSSYKIEFQKFVNPVFDYFSAITVYQWRIDQNQLTISWDDLEMDMPGTCDYGISAGKFVGKLTR